MGAVLCMFLGYHQRLVLKQSGLFTCHFSTGIVASTMNQSWLIPLDLIFVSSTSKLF